MKNIKKIIFALLIALVFPIINVYASVALTIDEKNYNENTQIFTVSGYSPYEEVMVTLFDGDELLSFKTVSSNNYQYTATFKIAFDEDKTVTIKVGDINSTEYKISTLEVKKAVTPEKSNKLTDEAGNSLTILDKTKKFELDDRLEIEVTTDFSEFDESDNAILEYIQNILGNNRRIVGIMNVAVKNRDGDKTLDETKNGYELFLNLNADDLSPFTKPYMARLLLGQEIDLDEGRELVYKEEDGGVKTKLNNIGIYIMYDDTNVYYKFLDNTEKQTYDLAKRNIITYKIDADLSKLVDVYLNNKKIDKKYLETKEGSTIITISNDYLKTLKVGNYNIKVLFNDGEANTVLKVINSKQKNPNTADNIIKFVVIGGISLVGMIGVSLYIKNKKYNKKYN